MIEVKNVTKGFRKKNNKNKIETFLADDNISFTASEGEVLGILGPNGAGKTTLLRMISGIMKPDSGEILIDNMDYLKNNEKIKKKIAFMSGNTKLYKDISPYELLKMCGEYYEVPKDKFETIINNIIKRFNMESFAKIWANNYSKSTKVMQSLIDIHSTNEIRVNSVLSSTNKFYEIYKIDSNDSMYIKPEERVNIWS